MIKFGFLLLFMLLLQWTSAQSVNASIFNGNIWAAKNNDSSFFRADTVRMIKLKRNNKKGLNFEEDLADFYKSDFVLMDFTSRKNLDFLAVSINNWLITRKKGKYSWSFDINQQIISILLKKKPFVNFKVVSKTSTHVKSNIAGNPSIIDEELLLIRLQ